MTWSIRPSIPEDVPNIVPRLREADLAECKAASGVDPGISLALAVDRSMTIVGASEEVLAMFGVEPVSDVAAAIWMVATNEITQPPYARQFIRHCRKAVDDLNAKHPLLFNYVDARNTLHLRWLRWCGFIFIRRHEKHGHEQRPFIEFIRINKCAIQSA